MERNERKSAEQKEEGARTHSILWLCGGWPKKLSNFFPSYQFISVIVYRSGSHPFVDCEQVCDACSGGDRKRTSSHHKCSFCHTLRKRYLSAAANNKAILLQLSVMAYVVSTRFFLYLHPSIARPSH